MRRAIASTSSVGELSYFSNYGLKTVDLAAPGSAILSTIPGDFYASYSGTSMAAPVVSGVAGELLANFPKLGPLELKALLMKSSTPVTLFKGITVSGGRVDLLRGINLGKKFKP